jgi:uncharacterized protein YndB with AHSA1/START domain
MDDFVADAIFIDAAPDRVFSALIDPEAVLEWLDADEARVAAGTGGEFAVVRADGAELEGLIEEFAPPKRLVIRDVRDRREGVDIGPLRIVFTLEPRDGGVWLVVRQEGLSSTVAGPSDATRMRQEWVRATVALKRHIEGI